MAARVLRRTRAVAALAIFSTALILQDAAYAQSSPPSGSESDEGSGESLAALGAAAYRQQQEDNLLQAGWLQLYSLASVDSEAVCNDGSPGGYYFNPSQNGPTAPWLIFLMGGDWCYNQESCQARMEATQFQVSSTKWANFVQLDGVFNPGGGNPFSGYNKVYIEYCSSDAWMGDVGASSATFNMNFRGQRIVSATLGDLVNTHGLPSNAFVVFGGCSAGARGAMATLDSVAGILGSFGATNADVKGLLDSGLWLDVEPLDTAIMPLMEQAQLAYSLFDPSALVPAACASANAGEEWRCIYGQFRMPYVQTPYFINSAQFDDFQLLYDTGGTVPVTAGQIAYADAYQQATVTALSPLVSSRNGVFSTTCLAHCLTTDSQLMGSYTADGSTIAQAIANWLQGTQVDDISSCQGYMCVQQCPGGSQIYDIQEAQQNAQQAQDAPPGRGWRGGASFLEGGAFGPSGAPAAASPPPGNVWDRTSVWMKSQMDLMGGGSHARVASGGSGGGYVSDPTGGAAAQAPQGGPQQEAQGPLGSANSWIEQGRRRQRQRRRRVV